MLSVLRIRFTFITESKLLLWVDKRVAKGSKAKLFQIFFRHISKTFLLFLIYFLGSDLGAEMYKRPLPQYFVSNRDDIGDACGAPTKSSHLFIPSTTVWGEAKLGVGPLTRQYLHLKRMTSLF